MHSFYITSSIPAGLQGNELKVHGSSRRTNEWGAHRPISIPPRGVKRKLFSNTEHAFLQSLWAKQQAQD